MVATGNTIYDNYDGVYLNDNTVTVTGNRIFVNTNAGVLIGVNGGTIEDNDIYSNATGVLSSGVGAGGYFNIQNNLIYANTTEALNLSGGGSGPGNSIIGNTIWQSVGPRSACRVRRSTPPSPTTSSGATKARSSRSRRTAPAACRSSIISIIAAPLARRHWHRSAVPATPRSRLGSSRNRP